MMSNTRKYISEFPVEECEARIEELENTLRKTLIRKSDLQAENARLQRAYNTDIDKAALRIKELEAEVKRLLTDNDYYSMRWRERVRALREDKA
jgi:hypothetical protein